MTESLLRRIQPLLAFAAAHPDADLSLAALSARAGFSPFHLHRTFVRAAGETPKQFALRLRLNTAAAMLLERCNSILHGAWQISGARLHEPSECGCSGESCGCGAENDPCIRLFQIGERERTDMAYSIETKELSSRPVLLIRKRVKRSGLAAALGDLYGRIFQYAQQSGAALAGPPFTRYLEWGPGLIHIEAGMPVAVSVPGEGEIVAGTLSAGPAASTVHTGPYEALHDAHAAVEVWIADQGLAPAGAPWESYITDPADYPNPADWKTEIFWPLAR